MSEPVERAIMVTGASCGIGRAIALKRAGDGFTMAVNHAVTTVDALEQLAHVRQRCTAGY